MNRARTLGRHTLGRRTIAEAMERNLGDILDLSIRGGNLGTIPRGVFTEPISLTPPSYPTIASETWTILRQKAVASALERNPGILLPLTGRQGKALVSRNASGELETGRAAPAEGATVKEAGEAVDEPGSNVYLWREALRG